MDTTDAGPSDEFDGIDEDRLLAAVHEAGHVVVARHVGVPATACICPAPPGSARKWVGRMVPSSEMPRDPAKARMIAVAGDLAVFAWRDELPIPLSDLISEMGTDLCEFADLDDSCKEVEIAKAAKAVSGLIMRGGPLWDDLVEVTGELLQ